MRGLAFSSVCYDWVTREAYGSSDKGLRWQWVSTLEELEFADDIALMTHRLQDIRCKIENLDATWEKVGLKLNVPNTKLIKVMTKQDGAVN